MRVRDGMYRLAPGVSLRTAGSLLQVETRERSVRFHALDPASVEGRIGGAVITVEMDSPAPDVFRLRAYHHRAEDGRIRIVPHGASAPIAIRDGPDALVIRSGQTELAVTKPGLAISMARTGQAPCCTAASGAIGYVRRGPADWMTAMLSLAPGEVIYGLGERFSPFVRNGQHVTIVNDDVGTTSDGAYKNVPFYVSSAGYGLLANSTDAVDYEVATECTSGLRISVPGRELEYLLFSGPDPKAILERYTGLTGRAPLIPKWSLGLWLSTSFVTSYDSSTVIEQLAEMARRSIEVSVFHFDCFWMQERHWCDFQWDRTAFPEPEALLRKIKGDGLRVSLWINPYVSQLSPLFTEGAERGYLLRDCSGAPYQVDWWQPGLAFVDFTNPEARRWFQGKLRPLLDMGVDTFKTDFGESAPLDAVYHDGSRGAAAHNHYAFLYNQTVFELLEEARGRGQAIVFARSATAGSQRFPVHWGGDSLATYESMAAQLRAGLSLALSGFAFWSHDIGGFFDCPDPDLYKRWVAFGLLSSHSRLHGNDSLRLPWLFGEEAVEVLRHFVQWRHRLAPYLYDLAVQASRTGLPVMRPMFLQYPEDPACRFLDQQYMLGDRLLVAPVFRRDGVGDYYLPAGTWYHLFGDHRREGGHWHRGTWDYFSLPLFVRGGSILPLGPIEGALSRSSFDALRLVAYGLETEAHLTLSDGIEELTADFRRERGRVVVTTNRDLVGAQVTLVGEKSGRVEAPLDGRAVSLGAL